MARLEGQDGYEIWRLGLEPVLFDSCFADFRVFWYSSGSSAVGILPWDLKGNWPL